MRFRVLLPVVQTMAMALILWAPWSPQAHQVVVVRPNPSIVRIWTLIPGPTALEWNAAINLPAVCVVTPVEFAIRRTGELRNLRFDFYGCWIVGLVCWYMTGRFLDDVVRWLRTKVVERAPRADVAFALIAVPSGIMLAGAYGLRGAISPVFSIWAILWTTLTCAALLFRVLQLVWHRRRPNFS